jgi:hypothetical protein
LGEDVRLLSDPYFPKHEEVSSDLYWALQQLSDFTVRNGEWLRPYTLSAAERAAWAQGELNPSFISASDSIWTVARRYPDKMVVQLMNFSGLASHQRWDEEHTAPAKCQNVSVKIQMLQRPAQVFWDAPELAAGPQALDFEYSNKVLTFQIPQINFIGLVVIYA